MIDLKKAVINGRVALEANDSAKWPYDRNKVLNASEAASCIRRQWYDKRFGGFKPNGFSRRGSYAEAYVVEALRAANVPLAYTLDDQLPLHNPDDKVAATPDGYIVHSTDDATQLEIKTIDPRTNKSRLPKEAHITQVQIGMHLARQRLFPAMTRGIILYMDASNYDDILTFEVTYDPTYYDVAKSRAAQFLRTRNVEVLDREGKRSGDCKTCDHRERCGVTLDSGPGVTRGNRGSNLHGILTRFDAIKTETTALASEAKGLAEDIKQEMASRGKQNLDVGEFEVIISAVKGRTTLDQKAMTAAGIDLSPFQKTGAPSERLEVKRTA